MKSNFGKFAIDACESTVQCSQVFVKLILLAFYVKDNILENNLALIIEKEWGDKLQVKVG